MCNLATFLLSQCRIHAILHARETMRAIVFVRSFLCGSRTAQVSNFYCYFSHIYVFTAISMICDICSGVISSLICMCNVAISTVLLYCIVTLVRLSLVTNKGYLLTYLLRSSSHTSHPSRKFPQNSSNTCCYPANKTDKQTDKRWVKHTILGEGSNVVGNDLCSVMTFEE